MKITGATSVGYHTFDELYDHRRALTAGLCRALYDIWLNEGGECPVWRSRNHHPDDTPIYDGYFIVGMKTPWGAVTYHYSDQYWEDFKVVPAIPHAPKWDGAGPGVSVSRLVSYARNEAVPL